MVEGGDAEFDGNEDVPIPYYPGRESLWIGSGLAKADVSEGEIIHPLANGAEAYYTYATGDSVSFRLPGGKTIEPGKGIPPQVRARDNPRTRADEALPKALDTLVAKTR